MKKWKNICFIFQIVIKRSLFLQCSFVRWILPMIKRWGTIWYYIGIAGNIAFIILYVITRFPGNPVNGRGGGIDATDMICELAQVAYIAITAVILAKERSIKLVDKEQLR